MHPLFSTRRMLLAGLAAFIGGSAVAQPPAKPAPAGNQPQARPAEEVKLGRNGELIVPTGQVVKFKPNTGGKAFKDVLTSNDVFLQVSPDADPAYIRLVGLQPGIAKITLTLVDGTKGEYEVVVQPDYTLLQRVIQKAVPTANIEIIPGVGNTIILSGYVNRPEDAETVMQIAQATTIIASTSTTTQGSTTSPQPAGGAPAYGSPNPGTGGTSSGQSTTSTTNRVGTIINAIQVGGLQHVQIEVVFASVNRSKIRQRGFDFSIRGTDGFFNSVIAGLVTPAAGGGGGAAATTNANFSFGKTNGMFTAALQALKDENLAKILTEPKIVTQSGRPATLRSGGQQAVLSASGGGLGSISVTLEQVGTTMQVLPIVYGNGKIYLEVSPTIRQPNAGFGIQTTSGFSTGFSEQSVQASVMLESGQSFAIGGLLETQNNVTSRKVPILGEIPGVAPFFSQSFNQEVETELVILVTPRLVDALDCSQLPKRVPGRETRGVDDYEFFLEGLLEAPRGQRQVWNGRCYQAAYKCDPTYGVFPAKGNVCVGGSCNAGGAASCPTCLPGGSTAPTLNPVPTAPIAAPAPAPVATLPTAAPLEPIVMPQAPAELPSVTAPVAPESLPTPVAPEVVVPGPVAPIEVPAPAPLAPTGEGN